MPTATRRLSLKACSGRWQLAHATVPSDGLATAGWDYEAILGAIEGGAVRVPVLGFTTHALARQTQPLHGRCERVVTKETLTQELPRILREGVAA